MTAAAPATTTSLRHPLPQALLVLTFTTGIVDAVSFLGLGVFTANMTGNVVLLGFGIAGSADLPIAGPFASFGAYALGAVVGGRVARSVAKERLLATALAIEVALLAAAAVLAAATTIEPGTAAGYVLIIVLAFVMGLRSACIRRLGASDIRGSPAPVPAIPPVLAGTVGDAREQAGVYVNLEPGRPLL